MITPRTQPRLSDSGNEVEMEESNCNAVYPWAE